MAKPTALTELAIHMGREQVAKETSFTRKLAAAIAQKVESAISEVTAYGDYKAALAKAGIKAIPALAGEIPVIGDVVNSGLEKLFETLNFDKKWAQKLEGDLFKKIKQKSIPAKGDPDGTNLARKIWNSAIKGNVTTHSTTIFEGLQKLQGMRVSANKAGQALNKSPANCESYINAFKLYDVMLAKYTEVQVSLDWFQTIHLSGQELLDIYGEEMEKWREALVARTNAFLEAGNKDNTLHLKMCGMKNSCILDPDGSGKVRKDLEKKRLEEEKKPKP